MQAVTNQLVKRLAPGATDMIRGDHTRVLALFHRYRLETPPARKQALAEMICLALEIHARIEEEIFYPAMRRVDPDLIDKSVPEHNEMRRLITRLRETPPTNAAHDAALMALMRDVMRHVADEETLLLPEAERALADELPELGARMTRRRLELAMPRAGDVARNGLRALPKPLIAVTGVMVLGAFLAGRLLTRSHALPVARMRRSLPSAARLRQRLAA
ncbi:MAG TPA: hemerythrin domain-containing protein [Casimicrobiaceae bacterium]|nr:hemerythrin domain-containing protein [Casimicrobiaceae bacterium]